MKTLFDLGQTLIDLKPGWRYAMAFRPHRTLCSIYAPERAGPEWEVDVIGWSYVGRGETPEDAFSAALTKILGREP